MPIDHVKLPVGDLDASRTFYTAALAPFGYKLVYDEESSLGFASATAAMTTSRLRFGAPTVRILVAASRSRHRAQNRSMRSTPPRWPPAAATTAPRARGPAGLLLPAFVLDPDGHNIEAVYHGPEARRAG